jgi:hypothetical protein
MKSKRGQFTPKELAYEIAIDALRAAYEGRDMLLDHRDDRDSYRTAARNQIAKLHNKLLDKSGMCGEYIGD